MMSLLHRHISLSNRTTILTIIFTLHFRVVEHNCPGQFIPELHRMLSDLEAPHDGHASEAAAARKMIVALAVSASASESNHRAIIESGFYSQFKRGLNDEPGGVELYGLLNIALNPKYTGSIWGDLRKIYKEVFKTPKIEFISKIDLFAACSRYLAGQPEHTDATYGASKALAYCLMRLLKTLLKKEPCSYLQIKAFLEAVSHATNAIPRPVSYQGITCVI